MLQDEDPTQQNTHTTPDPGFDPSTTQSPTPTPTPPPIPSFPLSDVKVIRFALNSINLKSTLRNVLSSENVFKEQSLRLTTEEVILEFKVQDLPKICRVLSVFCLVFFRQVLISTF